MFCLKFNVEFLYGYLLYSTNVVSRFCHLVAKQILFCVFIMRDKLRLAEHDRILLESEVSDSEDGDPLWEDSGLFFVFSRKC